MDAHAGWQCASARGPGDPTPRHRTTRIAAGRRTSVSKADSGEGTGSSASWSRSACYSRGFRPSQSLERKAYDMGVARHRPRAVGPHRRHRDRRGEPAHIGRWPWSRDVHAAYREPDDREGEGRREPPLLHRAATRPGPRLRQQDLQGIPEAGARSGRRGAGLASRARWARSSRRPRLR